MGSIEKSIAIYSMDTNGLVPNDFWKWMMFWVLQSLNNMCIVFDSMKLIELTENRVKKKNKVETVKNDLTQ